MSDFLGGMTKGEIDPYVLGLAIAILSPFAVLVISVVIGESRKLWNIRKTKNETQRRSGQ